jgi:peptide-methionine (S)-S-oxide reductase
MKIPVLISSLTLSALCFTSCAQEKKNQPKETMTEKPTDVSKLDTATIGGGCYWCTEAQYQLLDGVESVTSGFSGGTVKNPSYKEVCNGTTGHAEVIQVVYNTTKLNYSDILQAFFLSHDPTQLNRQGNDVGTQYRSVIFYHNEEQHQLAEQIKKDLDKSLLFPFSTKQKIITRTISTKTANSPIASLSLHLKWRSLRRFLRIG